MSEALTAIERLRQAAELLPAGASVTVSREALLEALGGAAAVADVCSPPGDLTVDEVATALHRKPSTVRGWLEAGRFLGAYRLPASGKLSKAYQRRDKKTGKPFGPPIFPPRPKVGAWRVPLAALEAFRDAQQQPERATDLGAWRAQRRGT